MSEDKKEIKHLKTQRNLLFATVFLLLTVIIFPARADSIKYLDKPVICLYDLVIETPETLHFVTRHIKGRLKYVVKTDKGHKELGVDFKEGLELLGLNDINNFSFVTNMDEYKCKEIK